MHSGECACYPFSPWRRGEGAAAAADEGRFSASPARSMNRRSRTTATPIAPHLPRPLIRCCRTTFSPLRGAKDGWCCRKNASCTSEKAHACPFSPLRGAKEGNRCRKNASCVSEKTPAIPSPRCDGAKGPACVSRDGCDLAQKRRSSGAISCYKRTGRFGRSSGLSPSCAGRCAASRAAVARTASSAPTS